MYEIQKNITRLDNGQPTFFLDPSEAREVKRKLGKNKVNVFSPFVDSEKIISQFGVVSISLTGIFSIFLLILFENT